MATLQDLVAKQNPDGGWGYQPGANSWTEPTCFALLALAADGANASAALSAGSKWLKTQQRQDGGWAPRAGVQESTWAGALVLLLPSGNQEGLDRVRIEEWLLAQTGRESNWVERLRRRLLGIPATPGDTFDGWPWYPGAAAWVTPTALTILALEKMNRERPSASLRDRIAQGRSFLLSRRCRDGGWNHGSTRALGYDSDSYPETTGVALLALHNSEAGEVNDAVGVAERHLMTCESLEAACWLTLGLLARGRTPSPPTLEGHGNIIEIALVSLTRGAIGGRNLFLT